MLLLTKIQKTYVPPIGKVISHSISLTRVAIFTELRAAHDKLKWKRMSDFETSKLNWQNTCTLPMLIGTFQA